MYHRFCEVLKKLGVEWDEDLDKAVIPCPECGSERAFSVTVSRDMGHCFKCGYSCRSAAEWVAAKFDISKREAYLKLDALCGTDGPEVDWREASKKTESPEEKIAPPEVLDRTYRALLRVCSLDDAHREALRARGLTDAEISRLGYGTIDLQTFARKRNLAGEDWLRRACGCLAADVFNARWRDGDKFNVHILRDTPGFFEDHWGQAKIVPCYRGILVPYRDAAGRIVGMQIRQDKVLTDKDGHQGPRYVWLSSRGKDGGATPGTPVHWAQKAEEIGSKGVYLTEGGLKGDIFRTMTGANVIAVPGVNAIKGVPAALEVLKARGVEVVVCAYDMDYLTNPSVAGAVDKLRKIVEASGMQWIRLRWDDRGGVLKGCDDWAAFKRRGIAPGGQKTA